MATAPARSKRNSSSRQYLVTTIRNGQMNQAVLTHKHRAQLKPDDVDVQIDEPKREIWIKYKGKARSTVHRPGKVSGFGVYEWDLMTDVVFSAGDIVTLKSSRHVNQRVRRIRRFFADSKEEEYFFVTTGMPYGIGLNLGRAWRYIEKLPQPDNSAQGSCDRQLNRIYPAVA